MAVKVARLLATIITATLGGAVYAQSAYSFRVADTWKTGGDGRWDYLTIGDTDHLLYVTRSTHTQVIDTTSGKVVADVAGGSRLHGTAVVSKANRAFVTDGEAGELVVFDLKSHDVLGKIKAADDADGIIYDAGSNRVLVSCGDAGQLLILNPESDIASAKCESIDLGGKPEFLAADGKGKAFVCINDKNEIAVVDLQSKKVISRWPTGSGTGPTGLAIDPDSGHLFVGCRNQKLIVLDSATGKVVQELSIGKGNDACAYDSGNRLAFASCGDGTLAVIAETQPGAFAVKQTVQTPLGARTVTVDPATHKLYLPAADMAPAEAGKRPQPLPNSFKIVVVSDSAASK